MVLVSSSFCYAKDADRCKLDMLQYWLDSKLVPKWNDVILALEETDQLVLAAQIKHDYLWSTTVSEEQGMSDVCVSAIMQCWGMILSRVISVVCTFRCV